MVRHQKPMQSFANGFQKIVQNSVLLLDHIISSWIDFDLQKPSTIINSINDRMQWFIAFTMQIILNFHRMAFTSRSCYYVSWHRNCKYALICLYLLRVRASINCVNWCFIHAKIRSSAHRYPHGTWAICITYPAELKIATLRISPQDYFQSN